MEDCHNDSWRKIKLSGFFLCFGNAFVREYKKRWGDVIAQCKQDRDIYKNATARILVDSDSIIAIEYADKTFDQCVIQVFTKTTYAREIVLYPAVCGKSQYHYDDIIRSGKDIKEKGILIENLKDNRCQILKLIKE